MNSKLNRENYSSSTQTPSTLPCPKPDTNPSQRFDFSSSPQTNVGANNPIGGIALDSYGPRKDLKGRGRGVTNRPAWLQERERKGLQTYDFVNK
jgi:hypothetical protein